LVRTAWELGGNPRLKRLRLRRWAHQLGFGGHWSSKSRRYSTTFTALRRARIAHALARRHGSTVPLDLWGRAASEQATVVLFELGVPGSRLPHPPGRPPGRRQRRARPRPNRLSRSIPGDAVLA
jgi:hypothetical protein